MRSDLSQLARGNRPSCLEFDEFSFRTLYSNNIKNNTNQMPYLINEFIHLFPAEDIYCHCVEVCECACDSLALKVSNEW